MRSQLLTLLVVYLPLVLCASINPTAPLVASSEIPTFKTVSFEDAQSGKDLQGKNITAPSSDNGAGFRVSAAGSCTTVNSRTEWRQYSRQDRLAFVGAIKCLMGRPSSGTFSPSTSRYEDFVRLHQQVMPNVHNNAKFLVWHRYYLWTFEQVVRTECGFNKSWPWWDETLDAGAFGRSDLFTSADYFGNLPSGRAACVTTGAFAGVAANIGPGSSNRRHCISRAVYERDTAQVTQRYVNQCNSRGTYAEMESCSQGGPHAYGHNGIGSTMADVYASPSDPIFWMHHAFIDRNFKTWQDANAIRVSSINGNDANGNALTLDTVISVGGIRPDVRVRDLMDTSSGANFGGVPFCYRYDR